MLDGALLGALLVSIGFAIGFGVCWLITMRYEKERTALQMTIGRLMEELQSTSIPEEEL